MTTTVAPNPHSPYADADPTTRHVFPSPIFFPDPNPGVLALTACEGMAVVPEGTVEIEPDAPLPDGVCPACVVVMQGGRPPKRPSSECRECAADTYHGDLCAVCRQAKHELWWPTRERQLPHDLYITAVINTLAANGLEPDDYWTSDAETDRYDDGPDAGCTTMLSAYLDWDTSDAYEDGIALVWEHPAEQWQWAPRKSSGVLAHDPEFLPTLPRWVRPGAVVATVRDLLAGREVSTMPSGVWEKHEQAQAAVDAWAAAETGE